MKFLSCLIILSLAHAQCVFNEFMIDPDDENTGEFIEIVNMSDSIIVLTQYFLCDAQDTDRVIAFPDSLLLPGQYGLILDPNYAGEYDSLIPDSISCFTIEDSRFGMYGISNSTSKPFSLLDTQGQISDSYVTGTPDWPDPGFTMERCRTNENLWQQSLYFGGTPGTRNSTSPKDRELRLISLHAFVEDEHIILESTVKNTGLHTISHFSIGYIMDIGADRPDLCDSSWFDYNILLADDDSCICNIQIPLRMKGSIAIKLVLSADPDIMDILSTILDVPVLADEIIITEFVCKTGDNFSSEYIEYCSRASLPIQCSGLQFADQTGAILLDSNYILMPDSMLVIAQSNAFYDDFPDVKNVIYPSAWRSLNNSGDDIRLLNPSGSVICDLRYDNNWDIPDDCALLLVDTALDYRDSRNWEASQFGSPGKENITEQKLHHFFCPEAGMFFTANDTLILNIINDGYFPLPEQTLYFETKYGTQQIFLPASCPGDTLLCLPDTVNIFHAGTQSCKLYCSDSSVFSIEIIYYYPYISIPCFFNEVLFDPVDTHGQTEFIELEISLENCNLQNWVLEVNSTQVVLAGCPGRGFTVISDNHDLEYSIPNTRLLLLDYLPNLPNAGADLTLYDPMGNIMDHCDLRDHPRLHSGKSLEKQYEHMSSDNCDIWSASVAEQGMTPATRNSITALPGYRNNLAVFPDVFSPGYGDLIQFTIDAEIGLSYCELYCYNMAGQEIYHTEQSMFSQPSTIIYWDGKMKNGTCPARGIYLLLAILHDINGETYRLRRTLVMK